MRNRFVLTCAMVIVSLTLAEAQPTLPPPTDLHAQAAASLGGRAFGSVDFGGRWFSLDGDEARHQRYRDLTPGGYVSNALFERRGEEWTLEAAAWNVGYRDQKYEAEYRLVGRLKTSFLWDQIPMFISRDTRTLYVETAPGVLRVDDSIQQSIQSGATTLRNWEGQAARFDMRTERRIGQMALVFNATPSTDVFFNVNNTSKSGQMPFGGAFGHGNIVEIALPLDSRTTDIRSGIEWANRQGMIKVGWDGSWFDNAIQTVVWDNPLRATDASGLPSQGLMPLWPTNTLHYVHGTGAANLPGRARLVGYLAVGQGRSNEPIVPSTINTALQPVTASRGTAEGEQQTTIAQLAFTMRPVRPFFLSAKYRYSDVDVRTPTFTTDGRIAYDSNRSTAVQETAYHSTRRVSFDVDGSYALLPFTALKVGAGRHESEFTNRHWLKTSENVFRASIDTTGHALMMVRALYENRSREGERFDAHGLGAGELESVRHFDIADRDRQRFTVIASMMPNEIVGLNASAGVGKDEFTGSQHGLLETDTRQYSVGMDVTPSDRVQFNVTYGWEDHVSLQRSRTATSAAQLADPTRDWTTDYDGAVRFLDAGVEFSEVIERTSIRVGLDWNRATDTYLYGVGSSLPAPQQLAPVLNELLRAELSVAYRLTERLQLGFLYWYDDYKVEDFALGETTLTGIALPSLQPDGVIRPTNALLLGYLYRPYTAHTGWVRLTYRF
jgi:MtrB/PioB family decaheme-associated outer membrane protein